MQSVFQELLRELGERLSLTLHEDHFHGCTLLIEKKLLVHLKPSQESLLLYSSVCPLPPGKFRENILCAALKANNAYPRIGTFAYYEKENQLLLFESLSLAPLNGEQLKYYLEDFIQKALLWKNSVEHDVIPSIESPLTEAKQEHPFGLHP